MAANSPLLDALTIDAYSNDLNDQMKVRFFKEVRSEDAFAEEMHDQCYLVRMEMAEMSRLMLELERRAGGEAGAAYIESLRQMQQKDAQKLAMLKELLRLARQETFERQLALDNLDDN
ncbi:hypothetical protein Tco_0723348 [Tanacetum coccineum]